MRQTALACSNLFVTSSICMYIYERARAHTHAHTRTRTLVYTYTHSHTQYLYLCVASSHIRPGGLVLEIAKEIEGGLD